MIRLFVAIDLPHQVKEQLSLLTLGIPGTRWTPPEKHHLTLRFIGEVDGRSFRDISELLEDIKCPAFPLQLKSVGHFGPGHSPRVLWAGVPKNEHLFHLRNKIDRSLIQYGLDPEGRKYSPHITLSRLGQFSAHKAGGFIQSYSLFETPHFAVTEFHLYSSKLTSKGSYYRQEFSYSLLPSEGLINLEEDLLEMNDFPLKGKYLQRE